jgi:hypothetical protein
LFLNKVFLCESQNDRYFDSFLQAFRRNIIEFRGKTALQLHSAYVQWYNKYIAIGQRVLDQVQNTNVTWNDACKKPANINANSQGQLETLCSRVTGWYEQIKQFRSRLYQLNGGDSLERVTSMEQDMMMLYPSTIDNIDYTMYFMNKNCFAPFYTKVLDLFKPIPSLLVEIRGNSTIALPEYFKDATSDSTIAANWIKDIANRINTCKQSPNPDTCIDKLVNYLSITLIFKYKKSFINSSKTK